ncbi:MAG TPA: hypothetical protein VGD43_05415 [Micromonospora sp.]
MVTYAQLQAEPYWSRETTTAEMDWLGDELCRRTGRPRTAVGIKGDNRHLRGSHRSQEWILNSRYCTDRTYTVQPGLTAVQQRHLAGFDFTPGAWGSPQNRSLMAAQTGRLLAAMKAGRLDEVRELYGTVDGRTVTGWNNVQNRPATADDSHLDHWHLGIDRRHCADRSLMARILAIALGLEDDDMTPEQLASADIWTNPYGDAPSNPKITLDTFVRNVGGDTRSALAELAQVKAELARLAGRPPIDVPALTAALTQAVVAAIREELDDFDQQHLVAAVETGVRRVLGSLDNAPST